MWLSLSLCLPRRFFQTMTFSPPRRTPKQHGCCNATLKRRWKNGFWADEVKWRLKNSWRPSWWALFTMCFWDFGGRFKKHQGELGSWNGDFTEGFDIFPGCSWDWSGASQILTQCILIQCLSCIKIWWAVLWDSEITHGRENYGFSVSFWFLLYVCMFTLG